MKRAIVYAMPSPRRRSPAPAPLILFLVLLALTATPLRAASIFDIDDSLTAPTPPPPAATTAPATPRGGPVAPPAPPRIPVEPAPPLPTPPARVATPALPVSGAPTAAKKHPIPPAADLTATQNLFKEAFAKELAERTPAARRTFAKRLLSEAEKADVPAADRFVLLAGARHAAEEAADLQACFESADRMGEMFAIDPLALKTRSALKVPMRADTAAHTTENCKAGLELLDQLMAAGDDASAARLIAALKPACAADAELAATLQKRAKRLDAVRIARQRAAHDLETLKTAPNDPAANLGVGQFLCFYADDWANGLRHLAAGNDPKISSAAKAEMELKTAVAADSAAAAAGHVGDAWWDVARIQADVPRGAIQRHAAEFYRKAIEGQTVGGGAAGLARQVMEKRIAEAAEDGGGVAASRVINLLPLIDPERDRIAGHWDKNGAGSLTVEVAEFARVQIPYKPPEEYDFRVDFTYRKNGGPVVQLCPLGEAGVVAWQMKFDMTGFFTDHAGGGVRGAKGSLVREGTPYTSLVKVRRNGIQAYLNNNLVAEMPRPANPINVPPDWRMHDPHALGIAVWRSDTVFTRVELTQITGHGEPLPHVKDARP